MHEHTDGVGPDVDKSTLPDELVTPATAERTPRHDLHALRFGEAASGACLEFGELVIECGR
jgi:hypothetical protein